MIIKPFKNDTLSLHAVDFAFIPPKQTVENASITIGAVLEVDAKKLAKKVLTALQTRSTIHEISVSSDYATVTFATITAESLWGSPVVTSGPFIRKAVESIDVITNLTTGKELSKRNSSILEKTYEDVNMLFASTYASSYYKAVYLGYISENFKTKNPASYVEIERQINGLKDLPFISSNLIENIVGSISNVGFISNIVLPIPSSAIGFNVPNVATMFSAFFNTYNTESLIKQCLTVDANADISAVITSLNDYNVVSYNGGIPRLYGIGTAEEEIIISDRLASFLTGRRGDLMWIFSSLSRLFEYNGAMEISSVNRNLRFFQEKLKTLSSTILEPVLYPEDSPRDLADLCISWFGLEGAHIGALLSSLDPLRKLHKVELVTGSSAAFMRSKTRLERVSPGLILLNEDLLGSVVSATNAEIVIAFADLNVTVRVTCDSPNLVDSQAYIAFAYMFGIKNTEHDKFLAIVKDLRGILAITLWLSNGDSAKDIGISASTNNILIKWPSHVIRRYSKLPIYRGIIKSWLSAI